MVAAANGHCELRPRLKRMTGQDAGREVLLQSGWFQRGGL